MDPLRSFALLLAVAGRLAGAEGPASIAVGGKSFELFPAALRERPDIPSPCRAADGREILTIRTEEGRYALVPVTIVPGATVSPWEAPLEIDREDFPTLARTGRHSEIELDLTRSITGRSLAEITELGRPGRLSSDGFLAEDEDIIGVLKGDDRRVKGLGFTHAELAAPLLRICNLIREVSRRTRGHHLTRTVFYGGETLRLEVELTKGGQRSIFDDGLDGAWTIEIRRDLDEKEVALLERRYAHLGRDPRDRLAEQLSRIRTGELQPFYIYRYGFYEGHTDWRTDPIAIASVFGLKGLEEIEAMFAGRLDRVLGEHFVREDRR
ncbi:MAG: hypothetical protein JXP34_04355 [Planctomycetes bacterium]|nr:hypothetical protein [Planctomycetota bacterium]